MTIDEKIDKIERKALSLAGERIRPTIKQKAGALRFHADKNFIPLTDDVDRFLAGFLRNQVHCWLNFDGDIDDYFDDEGLAWFFLYAAFRRLK